MRTQLFRTAPVLVNAALVPVLLADVDAAEPWVLYIENLDLRAVLTTIGLFTSKDAGLTFTAVTPGAGGNSITVQFTQAANQLFSIAVVGNAITVNLQSDAGGQISSGSSPGPGVVSSQFGINYASKVMDALNGNPAVAALVTVSLAPGSTGLAAIDKSTGVLSLAGGAASVLTGALELATSPLPPAQTQAAQWLVNTPFATAIPSVAANGVAAYEFTAGKAPGSGEVAIVRGVRLRVSQGVTPTSIVATGIVRKKAL